MYKAERSQIRAELAGAEESGKITKDQHVFVFGAGDYSREIIGYLMKKGISIDCILDNDIRKQNSFCRGIKIVSPDVCRKKDNEKSRYVICSFFWREMYAQLAEFGIPEDHIIVIVLDSFGESFNENLSYVRKGRKIYKEIKKKYKDSRIFLCPYTGTGDIYLIGTFLEAYLKKNQITDYVLVVVSNACARVASVFSVQKIYRIDGPEECRCLVKYYMVFPEKCDMKVLNDSWGDIYTNPVQWIRGLHGMDFATMFRKFVFDLEEGERPVHPVFKDASARIKELEEKYALKKGRTVILAPYATTLTDMPNSFWEAIATKLRADGWEVCTNCGQDEESVIAGTKDVFFPLDIAPQFIAWAGMFIGVRSGLCDVISGADAKKIILYDNANYFFASPAYEYFSLRKIGLSDEAVEICYDNQNLDEVRNRVLQAAAS